MSSSKALASRLDDDLLLALVRASDEAGGTFRWDRGEVICACGKWRAPAATRVDVIAAWVAHAHDAHPGAL